MSRTSVIIPTTGQRLDSLEAALESIATQSSTPLEILICGNLKSEELGTALARWQEKFPALRLQLFFSGAQGVNIARNVGIHHAQGEILVFLDDDCVLDRPHVLAEHEESHERHSQAVAIGGPYTLPRMAGLLQTAYHWNAHYWLEKTNASLAPRELLGGNLSFKKSLLGQNRFLESIRFGGSETELIDRLQKQGLPVVWVGTLSVLHNNRLAPHEFLNKAFLQGYAFGRRALAGSPSKSESHSPIREINRRLRTEKTPLHMRWPTLAMIYLFESFFQLGIEHAYSQTKYSPSLPTFGNYLKKSLQRLSGLNALRNAIRRWNATNQALSILKDSPEHLQ